MIIKPINQISITIIVDKLRFMFLATKEPNNIFIKGIERITKIFEVT